MTSSRKQKALFSAWWSVLCLFLFAAGPSTARTALSPQQSGNQSQQGPSPFRVIQVEVGSKGEQEGGQFVVEDLRTVFHFPADKQVVINFEWEGPPGTHQFQGTWRDSRGKVENISNFVYTTPLSHFSGYWILELPPDPPPGLWALEARIDGQPAGEQTFEVTVPPPAPAPPPVPTTAQVYAWAQASTVFITALDSTNEPFRTDSGFFIRPGVVLTTFGAIDGSSSLRIALPDGTQLETDKVVAWDYAENWAMLSVAGTKFPPLKRTGPDSWKVGQNCYLLGTPSPGTRTIEPATITGIVKRKTGGQRFTVAWTVGAGAIGSPVLDEYGHVIGMLQAGQASESGPPPEGNNYGFLISFVGPQVIPISLIPDANQAAKPVTLADLAAKGLFIPPLVRDSQVAVGYLCRSFSQMGPSFVPNEISSDFDRAEGTMSVLVTWGPSEKLKTTERLLIYDMTNHLVVESKPRKIELRPHHTAFAGWKVPTTELAPGIYRADVLLGTSPEWRGYFRIRR